MDYIVRKEDLTVTVHDHQTIEITFNNPINLINDDTITYELPWKEITEAWDKIDAVD